MKRKHYHDRMVEIYISLWDPTKDVDDDDAWTEVTFEVPFSYQPDEYRSTGVPEHWYVDGPITDDDGYEFDEDEIDELWNLSFGEEKGVDWSQLAGEAGEAAADEYWDAKIEAYEARMEAY